MMILVAKIPISGGKQLRMMKRLLSLTGVSLFLLLTGKTASAIVTSGDPNDNYYLVSGGETDPLSGISLDGVSDLSINTNSGNFRCTGSRIGSNIVLTAAHCVTDDDGDLDANSVSAFWETANGNFTAIAQNIFFHPDWNGNVLDGADVAIIEMTEEINSFVPIYDLFFDDTELGQKFTKVGYGRSGDGNDGSILSSGTKRQGQNIYDTTGGFSSKINDDGVLLFDFDNGLEENNAFKFVGDVFGETGFGDQEISSAPGDSGGPTFINGKIAGITSFGLTVSTDIDYNPDRPTVNSTFGEISGDARVSFYSDYIQQFQYVPVPFKMNKSLAILFLGGMLTGRKFLKK